MLLMLLRPIRRQALPPNPTELSHALQRLSALKACVKEDESGEIVVQRFHSDDTPSHGVRVPKT
jgi:hypothetical protein